MRERQVRRVAGLLAARLPELDLEAVADPRTREGRWSLTSGQAFSVLDPRRGPGCRRSGGPGGLPGLGGAPPAPPIRGGRQRRRPREMRRKAFAGGAPDYPEKHTCDAVSQGPLLPESGAACGSEALAADPNAFRRASRSFSNCSRL